MTANRQPTADELNNVKQETVQWPAKAHRVTQVDSDGNVINVQYPLSTDGDSVYVKDVWVDQSTLIGFSGVITDLFDNLHSVITNTTATDPKEILIHFNRTIPMLVVGLGAYSGNFSNVKIIGVTSGHVEVTLYDDSSDNTKKTSTTIFTPSAGFNAIKIQFHTSDTVTLSNVIILKATTTLSRIQGQQPSGDYTEFQATNSGNFKVSVEEYDGAANPVRSDLEGVGDITIGTSEVEIVITGTPTYSIRIRADTSNTGIIFIGKTGVLADGTNDFVRLESGDEVIIDYDDSSNALYAISDTATQKINVGVLL